MPNTKKKKTPKKRKKVSPLAEVNYQRQYEINAAYHAYMEHHSDPWERAKHDAWMAGYDSGGAEAYCRYQNYTMYP